MIFSLLWRNIQCEKATKKTQDREREREGMQAQAINWALVWRALFVREAPNRNILTYCYAYSAAIVLTQYYLWSWVLLVFTEYSWCSLSTAGAHWVLLVLLSTAGAHWIQLVLTEYYWCSLNTVGAHMSTDGAHWVLLMLTEYCLCLLVEYWWCLLILRIAGAQWVL